MPPRPGEPILHLHIGRNKAGSTTLQSYFVRHAEAMRQAGVTYALFNQPSPTPLGPHSPVLPTFPTHRHLADFVRAQTGGVKAGRVQDAGAVLVSHEGLCCFTPEMTRIMASDLAPLNIQLIFYVRPYGAWAVSSYNFDVRMGANGRDFDRYLETIRQAISFWPALEIWGQALGWHRVRVRSLHAADLQGGDLISDCLSAIGLPPPARAQPRRGNVSPSWVAIELLRTIVGADKADGWNNTQLAIAEALHELTDIAVHDSSQALPSAGYLTMAQAQELATQYNQDLAKLAARTGVRLQPEDPVPTPTRLVLPSAHQVPKLLMQIIRQRALAPDYARLHPELAEFVSSTPFRELCDS